MGEVIPGSSMVEQEAVNFEVAGSSPAPGATEGKCPEGCFLFYNLGRFCDKGIDIFKHMCYTGSR